MNTFEQTLKTFTYWLTTWLLWIWVTFSSVEHLKWIYCINFGHWWFIIYKLTDACDFNVKNKRVNTRNNCVKSSSQSNKKKNWTPFTKLSPRSWALTAVKKLPVFQTSGSNKQIKSYILYIGGRLHKHIHHFDSFWDSKGLLMMQCSARQDASVFFSSFSLTQLQTHLWPFGHPWECWSEHKVCSGLLLSGCYFKATKIDQMKLGLRSMLQYCFCYIKSAFAICAFRQIQNACVLCLLHTGMCSNSQTCQILQIKVPYSIWSTHAF